MKTAGVTEPTFQSHSEADLVQQGPLQLLCSEALPPAMPGWLITTRFDSVLYWQLRHVEDGIVSDASCGCL